MSIHHKILAAFALMATFLVAQSLLSLYNHTELRNLVEVGLAKNHEAVSRIHAVTNDMQQLRRYEKEYFIYITNLMNKAKYRREWQDTYDHLHAALAEMIADADGRYSDGDRRRFRAWKQAAEFYGGEFEQILEDYNNTLKIKEQREEGQSVSMEANERIHDGKTRLSEALKDALEMSRTKAAESIALLGEVDQRFSEIKLLSLSLTGIGILLAIFLLFVIPGGVNRTLRRLIADAERLAKGELSIPIEHSPLPEFESLAQSLESLRKDRLADSYRRGK